MKIKYAGETISVENEATKKGAFVAYWNNYTIQIFKDEWYTREYGRTAYDVTCINPIGECYVKTIASDETLKECVQMCFDNIEVPYRTIDDLEAEMEEQYTGICEGELEEIIEIAKKYFCDGIYVKSDAHPCGWDFISFGNVETSEDAMTLPIEVNDISNGCYDYHDYDGKTVYEIIETVGMRGLCFEISGVDELR